MRVTSTEGHMPKEIPVLIASLVQPNLVVFGVRKHDMKYAFCGPNRKIMSPQGKAEGASQNQR